jgi:molybdopterin-guanine dinucleotide biosynthesis protein B
MKRTVSFVGFSSSGKTTLICRLIAFFAERNTPVSVIKHTHHPISAQLENRGDTADFLAAGATDAILAGDGQALIWTSTTNAPREIRFIEPAELLAYLESELVLVEGFKNERGWARIGVVRSVDDLAALETIPLAAVVSTTPLQLALPSFSPADVESIARFVDRIRAE